MDDTSSVEEESAQVLFDEDDEEEVMELVKAIADDLNTYDCFIKPYNSPNERNDHGEKNELDDQEEQEHTLPTEIANNDSDHLQVRTVNFKGFK